MKLRNKILLAIMVSIWGLGWPIMKMGLNRSTPFIFISHRLFFSLIFLLMLNIAIKPKISSSFKVLKGVLPYSLILTFSFALTTVGLTSQRSGISAILTYTQPIIVFILAVKFLGETFAVLRLAGTILGFSGVVILFLEENASMSWTSLLLLTGAFLWAVSTVYYKLELQHTDAQLVNLIQVFMTSIIMYLASLFTEPQFQSWDWGYVAILIYVGIGASGIGMTIWLMLLKQEGATLLSSSSLIVPVLALFFGWLLIGEELNLKSLVGSILVIAGIYVVNQNRSNRYH